MTELLRSAGVFRLAPILALAAAAGAVLDVVILAALAQAAVSLTAGSNQSTAAGALSLLRGFTPGTLVLIGLGLCVLRFVPYVLQAELPARVGARVQEELRARLFHAYLHAPWLQQLAVRDGELQEVASTQTGQAAAGVLIGLQALAYAVTLTVLVAGAFVLGPVAAVCVLVSLGVLFFLLRPLARAVHRMAESNAELNASYMTMLNEAATIVSDTRTYGVVDAEEERLTASLERIRHPWQRVQRLHGLVPGAYQTAALTLLLVAVGIIAVAGLNASIGNLGAVVLVFLRALASSQQLQYSYQRLRESEPFADRAFALIDRLEERHPKQGTVPVARVERLSLEQVSFSYKLNRPALDHVTLDIRRGECVGVTGPSGAGKSTLAAVVLGLLTPDVGRYLVNGVPVDDIAPGDWSRLLGYVPQEGRLLTGTVSENIRFLRDGISSDDVEWAARAAHLHDDVVRWTDGYDTIVSQRTEAVSGGQRQRICLARALVCRPDLLVLDEPTSALDAEAEDVVFESLAALRGTVTMVVISHRPRLLGLCERVMHLRHGHTAEEDPAPGSPAAAAS